MHRRRNPYRPVIDSGYTDSSITAAWFCDVHRSSDCRYRNKNEIKKETVSWHSDKGNSNQVEFSNKLASVYDAYQKLLGPDAKELLEQAGCDDAAYPWSDAPVETIEAIVEVVQLPDEP